MPTYPLPWPDARPLADAFFQRDAQELARALLGKVIRHRQGELWLSARIIETEAYYADERGSHASLGYTHKRRALFLPGGHIYMYYARGGDSLNFSAEGPGNAVLIKSGHPWLDAHSDARSLARMQLNNPDARGQPRPHRREDRGERLEARHVVARRAPADRQNAGRAIVGRVAPAAERLQTRFKGADQRGCVGTDWHASPHGA